MGFRGLPYGKWFLGGCHKENGSLEVATLNFLGACHTENGFYVLATRKMVFRDLSVTRNMGFGGCHKENGF